MSATGKLDVKIRQIVRLKQVMLRWKHMSLRHRMNRSSGSDPSTKRRIVPGYLAVYVGLERKRFVIPTRFLNLPVFLGLLERAEEEFGYQATGGLVLPCDADFFAEVLRLLQTDEERFHGCGLEEFTQMVSGVGSGCCGESTPALHRIVTPLLQKARV